MRGFCELRPLEPIETDLFPTLVTARLATTIIIAEWRATLRPDEKDYILRNHAFAWRGLKRLSEAPAGDLRRLIHDTCKV